MPQVLLWNLTDGLNDRAEMVGRSSTAANLKEMAAMDTNTVESVEQSHFIRAYRTAKQQRQNYSVLSIGLKQQIDAMRISAGMEHVRIGEREDRSD